MVGILGGLGLLSGTRIGPYEVLGPIGAGGMGEVYRARDLKLNRDVALKILPEAFATDPERLARFEREAKTLASLNHPHIAQIHGFEESGPVRALVMELVQGEDLAERIARGRIPLAEALSIAQQIAEALEAAHELGVVHRDLKPANVKVRPDGTVKVLDFGLAKAIEPRPGMADNVLGAVGSSSITAAITMGGAIIGTAAYMAPEQATGKAIDRRADIWAFGCVLYEMLTAQRAFAGRDLSETLVNVLTKDVNWSILPSDTPAQIRSLLRRCLQRSVRERLRDIGDARLQVRDALTAPEVAVGSPTRSRLAIIALWAAAGAVILTAFGLAATSWRRLTPPDTAVTRFAIEPHKSAGPVTNPVLAPDGRFILYTGDRLYVQSLSEMEPRALPATEHAQMPVVSPDGRWVAFYADRKLKKVAIAGGDPIVICDVDIDEPGGAAWTRDNRILFSDAFVGNAPLMSVSADGGVPTPASTLERGNRESSHRWPDPLPDGRHVLFTIWFAGSGIVDAQIAVLDLATGKHRALFAGAVPRYAAGHLVYYRAGTHHVVRFDPAAQTAIGEPRPILPDALAIAPLGDGPRPLTVSENGTIAYLAGHLFPEVAISWIYRDGREHATPLRVRPNGMALAPDGERLAVGRAQAGTSQIWIHHLVSGGEQRLSREGYNLMPVWHPDGERLAFVSVRRGYFEAVEQRLDSSQAEQLLAIDRGNEVLDWLEDGKRAILKEWLPDATTAVTLLEADHKRRTPLVSGAFFKGNSRVSPDGRWLATCASPDGATRLYVRPLYAGGLHQVSSRVFARCSPHWSRRSNHLFYLTSNELVAATYEERRGSFVVLQEDVIAQMPSDSRFIGVTADAQRFLVGKPLTENPSGIRIVLNGLEMLMNAPAR